MTHFVNFHAVWNERKNALFEVWVSLVLMQNPDIWNFHGSLTLNNGNLEKIFLLHKTHPFTDF